jgi:acyl-CoA thioester hydrolase, YbgC/YbaW family
MLTYEIKLRVRYKETDAMGVVHHSNYVNYYEVVRTEMLREYGTTYKDLEKSGVMLPIHEVKMNFYSPAFYDDHLTIKLTMRKMPNVKMIFDHEIFNEQGVLINTGYVVLVFMNATTRKACRAPQKIIDIFRNYFSDVI